MPPSGMEQEGTGPRIEGEIVGLPAGDLRETALGFVAYLNARRMAPRQWFGPGYWRVAHGSYYVCGIIIAADTWRVFFFSGDYSGELEERYVECVQEAVRPCVSCVDDCPKGKDITVFGRYHADACLQFPVQYTNPAGTTLECVKALLEYWKEAAPRSDSWHSH